MNRKIYIANQDVSLAEYCPSIDNSDYYACWQDPDTRNGYNHQMSCSPEEFNSRPIRSRFLAVILCNKNKESIGIVSLSPESSLPDLAIMLYRPYRGKGYGTSAFALAAKYCLETFHLECLYAGCYESNTASRKMLKACGFVPHPEGNCHETHYLTGEPVIQYDFVLYRMPAVKITPITCDTDRSNIARCILESLTDWFGIPDAREEYIAGSAGKPFFCAFEGTKPVGFIYLKETGRHTVELAVMGVLKEHHRSGIGRELFQAAKREAQRLGYSFLQVKTVQMGRYDNYDATNQFYISLGFKEFEVFPTLWDEWNPCQIYIMSI